jgi:hypothetical protein
MWNRLPLALLTLAAASAQIPRTSDGHPDLQGVWTNATITPMERPADFAGKATATDAEARAYEKKDHETNTLDGDVENNFNRATGGPGVGAYNNLFVDRGSELARVDGVKRTSLIVDPPDGKIPALSAAARDRNAGAVRGFNRYDSVKDRPLSERCIVGFGSTAGPPMLPVLYNNNYQIVQTPDAVMILVEMVHDVRVVRMNAKHAPPTIRRLFGDSVGRWEGDTLVVDTIGFNDKTELPGGFKHTEALHVVERFHRTDFNNLDYEATVEDPNVFVKPWTIVRGFPLRPDLTKVDEFICENNHDYSKFFEKK